MPTKKSAPSAIQEAPAVFVSELPEPRPRLSKLSVKNFRSIAKEPLSIALDDIVVLVGPNNTGKSSILHAYGLVMAGEQSLKREDFHNEIVDPANLPEVILETIVFKQLPDAKYAQKQGASEEYLVRERWIWSGVDEKPTRVGFNFAENKWGDKYPWGPANIAQANRPKVHHVNAFSDPGKQAAEILSILQDYLFERLTNPSDDEVGVELQKNQKALLTQIASVRTTLLAAAQKEISSVETELSALVSKVFPDYTVSFTSQSEGTDTSFLTAIFKKETILKMGPAGDFQSPVELQGSGARRTLLWNILKFIAEKELGKGKVKKGKDSVVSERPHVLLLDEPEICLHPVAIREACKTLYDLPGAGRWQVMVTTHCPIFVDLSRDNTTIVRVDRNGNGAVKGTTIYRPTELSLSKNERELVKLLNIYDPYVAEFLFGGRTVIVEGDTEYTAFKFLCAKYPDEYRDLHIVKARGKATIIPLVKIMDKFSACFAVLHDSDTPTVTTSKGKVQANGAWTINQNIADVCSKGIADKRIRLIASVTTFEVAYFGHEQKGDKPYHVVEVMSTDTARCAVVKVLLDSLLDSAKPLPENAREWKTLNDLLPTTSNLLAMPPVIFSHDEAMDQGVLSTLAADASEVTLLVSVEPIGQNK